MSMPGFAAEASLSRTTTNYRTRGVHGSLPPAGAVVPQLRAAPGCGVCTPLTWPNGTPTGACAQACCDVLGRCWTEPCPCGGSTMGGIFNGGWGGVITW
jgi:hypothetical protein